MTAYEYDQVGNRTEVLSGNSKTYDYDTDPRYRLDEIDYWYKCDSEASITNNGGLSITRDGSGNPLAWGDQEGDYTKVYTYDLNSRLSSENYPGQEQTSNTYDWVGNKNPGTWTYNAADQLTSDGTHSYGYDYNGNLTTIDSTSAYTYTYTNLLSAKVGGTSMLWDASKNRVRFTSSTDQSYPYYFVYDATAGIPAVIEEVHDGDSVFYVREPFGSLICRIDGETTQYYGFDELGNTLFLTASNGTVSDKYTYDAWGNITSHTGSTSQPYQFVGGLGYYTHYQDTNMDGLLQLGVRFYDPELGRFTQRDGIKYGINLYGYVEANPVTYVDPSGYISQEDLKKVAKCASKCAGEWANGKKAWSKCFMKCMGKAFTLDLCIYVYCYLFPDSLYCKNGINVCNLDQNDVVNCQHCCDVKWDCCMIRQGWKPGGPAGCEHKWKKCALDCDCASSGGKQ